ncbi:hypothetical protein [Frigidibacter sp. MR17.24]|uniref:hypothetical protein n=1 Tax=Frigidibacter sp. MR17.24 TaxID=3127345 RepID=UPI003012D86F
MATALRCGSAALGFLLFPAMFSTPLPALAATIEVAPVLSSGLVVALTPYGKAGPTVGNNNIASPVTIGGHLYIVSQRAAELSILDATGGRRVVLDAAHLPAGVTPVGAQALINIAGDAARTYVGMNSATLPAGFAPPAPLPEAAAYDTATFGYELIYAYGRAADGSLSNPVPVTAFETTGTGHRGEGMLVLPDGRLLYARGDNVPASLNGLAAPQDPGSTLSKLLVIDPVSGAVTVAASGLRNVQHLTYTSPERTEIAFGDIGWVAVEEVNRISVADLADTAVIENFGWGADANDLTREGSLVVNALGQVVGRTSPDDTAWRLPFAEFGRTATDGTALAVSGPAISAVSFSRIGMLFGDLVTGALFATLATAGEGVPADVHRVLVAGPDGTALPLREALGLGRSRADLRFFTFGDGGAGLLLERSQQIYRITEVMAPVPLPAGGALMLAGGPALWLLRRPFRKARARNG